MSKRAMQRAATRTRPHGATQLLSLAVLAWTLTGCGSRAERQPDELQGALVIVLDTLRADHLSCYGYERPTTPNIDALAARGVRFERVLSCAPWTKPSLFAILAGEYPSRVTGAGSKLTRSLVETLEHAGVRTAAVTEGGYFSRAFGMDLGFDDYVEEEGSVQILADGEAQDPNAPGGIARTFRRAEQWLSELADERFFLVVHTYEPHSPYVNRDFAADLDRGRVGREVTIDLLNSVRRGQFELTDVEQDYITALYDGDILNSDRYVGRLLAHLAEIGLDNRTLVVVTSDHGEELADHYAAHIGGHGHSLRNSLLHVPLVIFDPLRDSGGTVVGTRVRTLDIMPTVLDLLDVPAGRATDGVSLVPMFSGAPAEELQAFAAWTRLGPLRACVTHGNYKYIATLAPSRPEYPMQGPPPPQQLYDLAADPHEQHNLVASKPDLARVLHESVLKMKDVVMQSDTGSAQGKDPALLERLRSLGYVE